MTDRRFYTMAEAAAELRVTTRTLRRWIRAALVRALRPSGGPRGRVLIPAVEIERLAAGETAVRP
ncbi:MAG: helix-turn-helix domain-containing protein [Planctomycetes bacterium]|nr:helix-turn-helix domain-containing protein [Planctomycetota bacterium]